MNPPWMLYMLRLEHIQHITLGIACQWDKKREPPEGLPDWIKGIFAYSVMPMMALASAEYSTVASLVHWAMALLYASEMALDSSTSWK